MATLTTSFQRLGEAYIGTSGGSLYVRIYARYTEQDITNNRTYVVYEARSYYDKASYIRDDQGSIGVSGTGAKYQSAGCTRPTGIGESVSVSTEGWVYHNNDGTKSISCAASISFPNWGWGNTAYGSADLPRIPRASGVACSSPYIGDNAIISIDKKASSFTNTLTYKIGTLTGTIATKTSETTVQFQTSEIEDQIYALIPNAKEIKGTIYCTTYNGSTQIGDTQSATFNLYAKESVCKPDVTATIIDTNTSVTSITGSNTKFVKYISKPKVTVSATAKKSSTIKNYSINLNDGQTSNLQENTFDSIGSNKVTVSATDSRGYSSSSDVELDMIDYIKLHINTISITRPEGTSNEAILNCNGAYYNGSFTDTTANTLSGSFKYRKSGETDWIDGESITPTITDNTFKITDLSLGTSFDYEEEYQFEITFEDKFVIAKEIVPLEKGRETIFIGDNKVYVYGDAYLNEDPVATYQVGDLFLTTRNENPNVRFGGIWELYGKGKVLVCVDEDDNDFNVVNKTGGEKTHKLTIDEMPSHQHDMDDETYGGYLNRMGVRGDGGGSNHLVPQYSQTVSYSKYIPMPTGGNQDHNNLPPYITCFIWKRIE